MGKFKLVVTYADYYQIRSALQHELEHEHDPGKRERLLRLIQQITDRIAYCKAKFAGELRRTRGRQESFKSFMKRQEKSLEKSEDKSCL